MAAYTEKTATYLQSVSSAQTWWNSRYSSGDTVPFSGIYRCTVCGKEVTCNATDPFPPQNHSQHKQQQAVEWQLIIRSDTKGDNFGVKSA